MLNWLMRLFRKRKLEVQLDSELRFHLDQRTADLIAHAHWRFRIPRVHLDPPVAGDSHCSLT